MSNESYRNISFRLIITSLLSLVCISSTFCTDDLSQLFDEDRIVLVESYDSDHYVARFAAISVVENKQFQTICIYRYIFSGDMEYRYVALDGFRCKAYSKWSKSIIIPVMEFFFEFYSSSSLH